MLSHPPPRQSFLPHLWDWAPRATKSCQSKTNQWQADDHKRSSEKLLQPALALSMLRSQHCPHVIILPWLGYRHVMAGWPQWGKGGVCFLHLTFPCSANKVEDRDYQSWQDARHPRKTSADGQQKLLGTPFLAFFLLSSSESLLSCYWCVTHCPPHPRSCPNHPGQGVDWFYKVKGSTLKGS